MRIVQLIDSLEPGGAERMAVNYANSFCTEIEFSGLVVTRVEGSLKKQIVPNVNYLFLNRKRIIDFKALFKFRNYLKTNKVHIVQTHSSSYFFACLVKIIYPKIKIVWHDHFGNRYNTDQNLLVLKGCSFLFNSIFCVNKDLQNGAKKHLYCKDILFFPNFAIKTNEIAIEKTILKGVSGKRMVCLANLKNPKNHLFLIQAFNESKLYKNEWSLHLIGKDYNDSYSSELKKYISINQLTNSVFIYGSCNDISTILEQATIGVLASTYEGFPVTLLEYGLAKLAVLSTNVGFCNELLRHQETGFLFSPFDKKQLIDLLKKATNDDLLLQNLANNHHQNISANYSEKIIVTKVLTKLQGNISI